MQKSQTSNKLRLSRETIRTLSAGELSAAKGAAPKTRTCATICVACTGTTTRP